MHTIPDKVPYTNPLLAGRHPFQIYLLMLCAVSGIPLVFGVETAGSVNALLPDWAGFTWGLSLSLGSALGIVGAYWPRSHIATALTLEEISMLIVGPSAMLYAVLIALYIGWSGTVTVLIVAGFGLAALTRARHIAYVISRAIKKQEAA